MREDKDKVKTYFNEYLAVFKQDGLNLSADYGDLGPTIGDQTPEQRIVVELNDIGTMLAEIAIALKRIAPYFEERIIHGDQ